MTRPARRAALSGLLILAASIAATGSASASWKISSGQYQYREDRGDHTRVLSWQIAYPDGLVEIHVDAEDYRTVNLCRENGETVFWSVTKKDGSRASAVRERDELVITRSGESGQTVRRQSIDERPWFQPLSYSLRMFLQSDLETITFWGIRMDTDKAVLLQAEKIGPENLVLENRAVPALKVKIRLTGLLSLFWHGFYWYSREDGLFLCFENKVDFPGVTSRIFLVEKPDT